MCADRQTDRQTDRHAIHNTKTLLVHTTKSFHLASPVLVSIWLIHALYTSTGLVIIVRSLLFSTSCTSGPSRSRSMFWPPLGGEYVKCYVTGNSMVQHLVKWTTILMTVGLPVMMSLILSTLDLQQAKHQLDTNPTHYI